MKNKRHGVLFTALTLVLGLALLTTTLAAPRLRLVGQPMAQMEYSVAAQQAQQPQSTAAESEAPQEQTPAAAAPVASAGEQEQPRGLQSPAYIELRAPAPTKDPGDQDLFAEVWEHDKDASNVPGDFSGPKTAWSTPSILLDVFSSMTVPSGLTRDPSLKPNDIVIPGSEGSYRFTIENQEAFGCEYEIALAKGIEATEADLIPLVFNLRRYGVPQGTFTSLSTLKALPVTGNLNAGERHEYVLDWKWPFEVDTAGDIVDTALGERVQSAADEDNTSLPTTTPYFQLQMNVTLWAEDQEITIKLDPDGGIVSPTEVTYLRGESYSYRNLPIPTRDGYKFLGWSETPNGAIVDPDRVIPPKGGTLYAVWEVSDDPGFEIPPWVWLLPPVIAAPLIPIIGAISLLPGAAILLGGLGLIGLIDWDCCWLCLRPCDECTCNGKCHNPKCPVDAEDNPVKPPVQPPKTGDSYAAAWSALALLALSGAAAVVLAKKRREEDAS